MGFFPKAADQLSTEPALTCALSDCACGLVQWDLSGYLGRNISHMVGDPASKWQPNFCLWVRQNWILTFLAYERKAF